MRTTSTVAPQKEKSVSLKATLWIIGLSVGYLLLSYVLVGFKTDQLLLVGLFSSLYYLSPITRKFALGFTIFMVFWVLYDYMKAFPNYWFNEVHIKDLYEAEKAIFGVVSHGDRLTPNEYWAQHHHTVLDVLSGIFYLSWVPVPMGFAAFLFFRNRTQFTYFSLTFLLVNLLGFAAYYLYPAAPPWYVQLYGFDFIPKTPGNMAGLFRFDAFFQINLFRGMYAKGSNVFAAMPSLHSAYPLIVVFYAFKNRLKAATLVAGVIMVGIWFAAVYTSHHYILDVLFGILCAASGIALFNYLMARKGPTYRAVQRFIKAIE
ncbi:phosphatase PAP2 family protein [Rufibacter latericius]|uniref:Inositol phosphorylceramide synthase n=1 Tax=Rufibacter latericius TaxID=2487040 RepID=A0A3M9MAI5_9BACT|nr:phosphatase PAP2 family protein [Rufibacter latericius]RNI21873.1 inositol phosphorylceramide synthase [Rufibacter latericius]